MLQLRRVVFFFFFFFLFLVQDLPLSLSIRLPGNARRLSRLHRHLKRFNMPGIHSIQSPDGDIIDCVVHSNQAAFHHPLLKGQKPKCFFWSYAYGECRLHPEFPQGISKGTSNSKKEPMRQLWHLSGRCPNGTIPTRRTTVKDLLRASSISDYGRKRHHPANVPSPSGIRAAVQSNGHQHAIAYVNGGKYYGAKAVMNVWGPNIEVENEFSLSQIWILAGSFDGDLNSIEAGWQVSPDLYGDNNTRLFTYWTSDAYRATGCYNLLCSGFVQVSDEIAIGATISPVSAYDAEQYDISILLWKDPKEGDWWMSFGDNHVMGYWPSSLFTNLADSASMVEWGGEVVNSNPSGQHTLTQMGSGRFPLEGFGKSSYFSNLQIVDSSNNLGPPADVNTYAEQPGCYDVHKGYNNEWGSYFYYGGPGRNDNCL